MTRCEARAVLRLLVVVSILPGCVGHKPKRADENPALAARIEQLVETFLMTDDDAKTASALAEARGIFEHEGIPSVSEVGDAAAYGFVLMNMLGQTPDFRERFFASVREAAARRELPEDALMVARARQRQTEVEARFRAHMPSHPQLRDEIARLLEDDQAVRKKAGFDRKKMDDVDERTSRALGAIFDRHGVPTFDMVGMQAARDFVVMVQHQPPAFRLAVLPKLKANVDTGQAEPATYAMVYDRTQRDQGKPQWYGQQLECGSAKTLDVAPIDDAPNVDLRRAELGLMRLEIYARLVRAHSPDICGSGASGAADFVASP